MLINVLVVGSETLVPSSCPPPQEAARGVSQLRPCAACEDCQICMPPLLVSSVVDFPGQVHWPSLLITLQGSAGICQPPDGTHSLSQLLYILIKALVWLNTACTEFPLTIDLLSWEPILCLAWLHVVTCTVLRQARTRPGLRRWLH